MLLSIIIGACLGSFIVCIHVRRNSSDNYPRYSVCDTCKRPIRKFDLIPILSFCFLRGLCRFCKQPIPKYYFMIEILSSFLSLLLFLSATNLYLWVYALIITFSLLLMSIDDLSTHEIQTSDLCFFSVLSLFSLFLFHDISLSSHMISAIIYGLVLYLCHYFKPNALGIGDVYLVVPLAFSLGVFIFAKAFLLSMSLALCYSVSQYLNGNFSRSTEIPLVPFLALGYFFYLVLTI